MSKQDFILKIPTHSTNLKIIRDFISDIAGKAGFTDEVKFDIALAVDEACTNVIKHAYRGGVGREITINVRYDSEKIVIAVSDSGNGFDTSSVDNFDIGAKLKKMERGGLGIHLIKETMDEVEFKSDPKAENSVVMTKYVH